MKISMKLESDSHNSYSTHSVEFEILDYEVRMVISDETRIVGVDINEFAAILNVVKQKLENKNER